ncbi:prostaglandin E2 receptor EP4 subtype-like [Saccostrea cucullata]|uniref:prostaglandin E2 receptor EP4 subtype-like n=1 Tax=Saccostrea cuccullata TaxID=36930 RepID=UPI002ED5830C
MTYYPYAVCNETTDLHASQVPTHVENCLVIGGNLIAFFLMLINSRYHQWHSFYILFAGLVFTDLLQSCVLYPVSILRYTSNFTWCYTKPLCDTVSFTFSFTQLSSGAIVSCMAIDRYLCLKRTKFLRRARCIRLRYFGVLCAVWCFVALVCSLHLIGLGNSQLYFPGSWCFIDFTQTSTGNRVNSLIYSVCGICVIISTSFSNIASVVLSCKDNEYRARLLEQNRVTGVYDTHVTIFLVVALFVYVAFFGPFILDVFLHVVGLVEGNGKVELWLIRLSYMNSIINPWLYIVLRKESLLKFVRMYYYCCRSSSEETLENKSSDTSLD